MKRIILYIAIIAVGIMPNQHAHAKNFSGPILENGKCDKISGVKVGDDDVSQFECDSVVINRSPRGTVLIQFTDKSGRDGRILGFAGTIEGKQGFGAERVQALEVERLYLMGGGRPINVMRGTCFLNWAAGKLINVGCDAVAQVEGQEIKALSVLTVH
jgi:hypothetical protein